MRRGENPDRRTPMNCANCGAAFLRISISPYCCDECRFISKVEVTDSCWIWRGTVGDNGYGAFGVGKRKILAHRYSYMCHRGEIAEGLHLDHLCRVRACVNPWHLEPVTPRENFLRGESPTAVVIRTLRCIRGHAYTAANTYVDGKGKRRCRTCSAERERQRPSRRLRNRRKVVAS